MIPSVMVTEQKNNQYKQINKLGLSKVLIVIKYFNQLTVLIKTNIKETLAVILAVLEVGLISANVL